MAVIGPTLLTSDRGPGARAELRTEYKKRLIRRQRNRAVFCTMLFGDVFGKDRPMSIPKIRHEPADDGYRFRWFETTRLAPTLTLTETPSPADTDTAFTVGDCSMCTEGEVLRVISNPAGTGTGELMIIPHNNWDEHATNLVVRRGMFGTTANSLATGAVLLRLAPTVPETGVTTIGSRAGTRSELYGATQEVWVEMSQSKRRRSSPAWYGWDWIEDEKDRIADFFEGIERAFLFMEAAQTTETATSVTGTPLLITTAGLEGRISTHRFDAGGNCGYDDFIAYMGTMARANAGNGCQWIVLAGQRVLQHLSLWGIDYYKSSPGDDTFGLNYSTIDVPNIGKMPFYWCPVLDESEMSDGCYILDTQNESLALRYLREGPPDTGRSWDIATTLDGSWLDITATGSTDKTFRLECNVGLEVNDEARFGLISRFTTQMQ
jgi:hypothetical protein